MTRRAYFTTASKREVNIYTPNPLNPVNLRYFPKSSAEPKRSIASRVQLNYRCIRRGERRWIPLRVVIIVIQPAPFPCKSPLGLKNPAALPCVKNFMAESASIRSRYATLPNTWTNSIFLWQITVTDISRLRSRTVSKAGLRPVDPLTDFMFLIMSSRSFSQSYLVIYGIYEGVKILYYIF